MLDRKAAVANRSNVEAQVNDVNHSGSLIRRHLGLVWRGNICEPVQIAPGMYRVLS